MVFNSYIYVLTFLPVMILLYYLPGRINDWVRKAVLILGSLIFYGYLDISTLKVLVASIVINLVFAILIEKVEWKRFFMIVPVIINIGLLLYYKYTNFAITNINVLFHKDFALKDIVLPLGISFFTFQQIAYIVAVYKKEVEKVCIIDYITYILYFPKLLMGPLMEPCDFLRQLNDEKGKKIDWDNIACGVKIFSYGLLKKVLLADTFAKAVTWGFSNLETATALDLLLVMLFYTFEIYFDFSGYSDMAVGSSLMFNITLPINFDSPYKAISIRDFWKRWHISLTSFLTRYIYIPLGGSRKGILFTCINTMIVFLISGIWHGANWTFLLWGALHGAFSLFDRLTEKIASKVFRPIRWFLTFCVVNILWLLFRADSIQLWGEMLRTIISFVDMKASDGILNVFTMPEMALVYSLIPRAAQAIGNSRGFMMIGHIVVSFCICLFAENNYKNMRRLSFVSMLLSGIALAWGITCLGSESVFVYFNF